MINPVMIQMANNHNRKRRVKKAIKAMAVKARLKKRILDRRTTMKIEVTKAQLNAIINLSQDAKSMIGSGDDEADKNWSKYVTLIERMFDKNQINYEFIEDKQ